jgi:hypothetical protein
LKRKDAILDNDISILDRMIKAAKELFHFWSVCGIGHMV